MSLFNTQRIRMQNTTAQSPTQTRKKWLRRRILSFLRFLKSFVQLGKLAQYPSKPLVIPKYYFNEKTLSPPIPTISIITPSYNQAAFLEKTIESVIEQDYPKLEYIIQDGASSDHSAEIIQRYQSQLRFWDSKKDDGQTNAINRGFSHSTGEIMAYLNSDDLLLPGSLNYVAHFFQTHPNIDVIYGNRIIVNENGDEMGRWILPGHSSYTLRWSDFIPQETLFWRRRIWEKIGSQLDEHFKFAMDWDLLLRFQDAGARFAHIPRFLGAFRVHAAQKTSSQINTQGLKEMEELRFRSHRRKASYFEVHLRTSPYYLKHLFYRIVNKGS